MKRSKKWFIACLTLFALVAPYLLISSDASALSYAFNAFPVINKRFVTDNSGSIYGSGSFSTAFKASSSSVMDNFIAPEGDQELKILNNGQCQHDTTNPIFWISKDQSTDIVSIASGAQTNVGYRFEPMFNYSLSELESCWNSGSYDYDGMYGADINLSTGVPTKLVSLSQIIASRNASTTEPMQDGAITYLEVPLGLSQQNIGTIPANTPLKWEFSLGSKSEIYDITDTPQIRFRLSYMAADPNTFSGSQSDFANTFTVVDLPASACSFNDNYRVTYENDEESGNIQGVQVSCSYTPSTPMSYVSAVLRVNGSSQNASKPILRYRYNNLLFGGNYFITNNDRTWSGILANDQPTGNNIHKAPGWTQLYGEELQPGSSDCNPNDWSCQLENLFSFDVLNPFRPLFNLFMDQNTCQQIPIIAGMIHSQETQVCPWFSPSTRNIVTPVLGIASIMLLFGFIVRWLGARSGNFFEDSTDGHDVGSVHVGRRNKK